MQQTILNFDKPKKVRSTEAHNEKFQSDSGVPGTYMPNMSDDDQKRYKASKHGGARPRIEFRVTRSAMVKVIVNRDDPPPVPPQIPYPTYGASAQVRKDYEAQEQRRKERQNVIFNTGLKRIRISTNGAIDLDLQEWLEFKQAVEEAIQLAAELKD